MENEFLRDLNFKKLLHYSDGAPKPEFIYSPPLACDGFCVSCEQNGLLNGSDKRLYRMSHGADTSDFESLFGRDLPLEKDQEYVKEHVMFVLESPGGKDDDNGIRQTYLGVEKEPPVCGYYWMPRREPVWPSKEQVLANSNPYGPYFAYLLRRFRLKHAYFTNVIKCGLRVPSKKVTPYVPSEGLDISIRDNCCREFLAKEVEALEPKLVFAFGDTAHFLFSRSAVWKTFRTSAIGKTASLLTLYHPHAHFIPRAKVFEDNDGIIQNALVSTGLTGT